LLPQAQLRRDSRLGSYLMTRDFLNSVDEATVWLEIRLDLRHVSDAG
jgi:hypothetical protein